MEQFDQLDPVPRFQALQESSNPSPPEQLNQTKDRPVADKDSSKLFLPDENADSRATFSTGTSGLDFIYRYRDGNLSPSHEEAGNSKPKERLIDGEEHGLGGPFCPLKQSATPNESLRPFSTQANTTNTIAPFSPGLGGLDFLFKYRDSNLSPNRDEHEDNEQTGHQSDGDEHGMVPSSELGAKSKVEKFIGYCKVCGDGASGMYFGALVCVPCKTFFLRYYGDNFSFECRNQKDCEINTKTRTQCKYCRMQKCLQVGMLRRVRPSQVQISEGQQLCVVCSDLANGLHFGAITCEGCKKFFRRGLKEHPTYVCKNDKDCVINPRTRNACRFCRYQKCLAAGMCREAIQMGRPSKFRGHSLYNSNLPFPNKMSRMESNGSPPAGMSTVPNSSAVSPTASNAQYSTNLSPSGGSGIPATSTMMPKSLPVPQIDSQLLNMVSAVVDKMNLPAALNESLVMNPQQQPMTMREVKQEPPDYQSFSPYPPSTSLDSPDSILNISTPWIDVAIKTMNQEVNCAVSNFLTSNQNELLEQIAQNLKYSQAGLSTTETSGSLTTMTSVLESRPHGNSTEVVHAGPSQVLSTGPGQVMSDISNYQQRPVPSPEELDIMANIQKALGVLEDPEHVVNTHPLQDTIFIGRRGNEVQYVSNQGSMKQENVIPGITDHQFRQQQIQQQYNNSQSSTISPTVLANEFIHDHHHQQQQQHPSPQQQPVAANLDQSLAQHHHWQQHQQQPPPVSHPSNQPVGGSCSESSSSLSPQSQQHLSPVSHTSSQQSPQDSSNIPSTNSNKFRSKVPFSEIMNIKKEVFDSVLQPLEAQQDSLESFNNFMELSHLQLTEWIEFLQRERKTSNSPNSNTIRAIKQTTNQDFNPDYWQAPDLPDENIFFTEYQRVILSQITKAYSAFVEGGHKINQQLTAEFKEWYLKGGYTDPDQVTDSDFPDFFNKRVVELYTVCSVSYCKKLPGFVNFDPTDQYNIVRLGQSQSRILAAACHWYNRQRKEFDYFLSWKPKHALREYKFKDSCLKYAEMIVHRDWDPIESALTNVLVLIATDYPDLKCPDIIEETRMDILRSFRAYTTAKYGTPNRRIEELFSYIPKLRELGLLHYKWTMVTVLEQETIGNKPNTGTQEDLLL